ncbi:DUF368 domain-containing protein [Natranaerobius trueperi]|uniref:DUF368 domain-containing protein n=1 Tax=Natranaerobius trueperi TaxID=759412 RepID=A0A226BYR4_9FIRM|nr:DUF368 domain-containing protein [Natranaerobius trueperi]OWZ83257.1 hypothetical protein CDO51_09780 [Natranaerobius trueperi]
MKKQSSNLKLILSGGFIGLSNLIPGISGGTIAVISGIYEDLISALTSRIFSRDNLTFFIYLAIGALLAILIFSQLIEYMMGEYLIQMQLLFAGLIFGSLPSIYARLEYKEFQFRYLLSVLLAFLMPVIFLNLQSNEIFNNNASPLFNILSLFIAGLISSATMVIPGVSGGMILMVMGMYNTIISAVSNFDLMVLLLFGFGVLSGVLLFSHLIKYLITQYTELTYLVIIGLLLGSVVSVWPRWSTGMTFLLDIAIFLVGCFMVIAVNRLVDLK